ncbi:hypothetical protein MMC28_010598 [Mycoblastus sanguinarius]|nr:hypothetical protein [Mycoblastus sanguinarius]
MFDCDPLADGQQANPMFWSLPSFIGRLSRDDSDLPPWVSKHPGQRETFYYYRGFADGGQPCTDFFCKSCNQSLGHTSPDSCPRCGPFGGWDKGRAMRGRVVALERIVRGFWFWEMRGWVVGEYVVRVGTSSR